MSPTRHRVLPLLTALLLRGALACSSDDSDPSAAAGAAGQSGAAGAGAGGRSGSSQGGAGVGGSSGGSGQGGAGVAGSSGGSGQGGAGGPAGGAGAAGAGAAGAGGGSPGGAGQGGAGQGGQGGAAGGGAGEAGASGSPAAGLTRVGTGEYATFYLVDGVIYGYGGGSGLLGLGDYEGLSIPPRPIATPAGLKFRDVQGGLHQSMAVDVEGRCWTWGDAASGLPGAGDAKVDKDVPHRIETDADGAVFDHVVAVEPVTKFNAALKDDGTVWVWGDCSKGVTGDGTDGGIVTRPKRVPIPLPDGVKITKIDASGSLLALASDGSVWAWGSSEGGVLATGTSESNVPHQVQGLPPTIKDIAVGFSSFFYAVDAGGSLYGWGYRSAYLGLEGAPPTTKPLKLDATLKLPAPVRSVAASMITTHVILEDGSLWGWGDAACGGIGDGQEPDWSQTPPPGTPYGWDFKSYTMMVYQPSRIVPGVSNFRAVFANSAYDLYIYALTDTGDLYSWGRNKTGTLGDGVYPRAASGNVGTSSNMAATYPNCWDVPTATLVTPMTVAPKGTNCAYCVDHPTAKDCF